MSSKNVLLPTLVALAAGIAIGILIAPAKGKDTRKKLLKAAASAKDTLHYALLQGSEMLGSKKEAEPA
jgi:gas vesicle protein